MVKNTQNTLDTTKNSAARTTCCVEQAQSADLIAEFVEEIKNMSPAEARKIGSSLVEQIEAAKFKLGCVLLNIKRNWKDTEEKRKFIDSFPPSLAEYTDDQPHKSLELMWSPVPWEKLVHIPWSRLNHVADIVTLENVDDLVSHAKQGTFAEFDENTKPERAVREAKWDAERKAAGEFKRKMQKFSWQNFS